MFSKGRRAAADITSFRPEYMGMAEALMWKQYYDRKYIALCANLFFCARHVGFSSLLSVRLGFFAAQAAHLFQASRSRREAYRAVPFLESYYDLIAIGAPARFCPREVAVAELDWWQARRENKSPDEYGLCIAHVASLVYGVAEDKVALAGLRRAQAMDYRDRHRMTQTDWDFVSQKLVESYSLLKSSLSLKEAATI